MDVATVASVSSRDISQGFHPQMKEEARGLTPSVGETPLKEGRRWERKSGSRDYKRGTSKKEIGIRPTAGSPQQRKKKELHGQFRNRTKIIVLARLKKKLAGGRAPILNKPRVARMVRPGAKIAEKSGKDAEPNGKEKLGIFQRKCR